MKYHYVWLIWSSAFLLLWIVLYRASASQRGVMLRTSLYVALLGLTEPIFGPAYWNPPSLFELAQEHFAWLHAMTPAQDAHMRRSHVRAIRQKGDASYSP